MPLKIRTNIEMIVTASTALDNISGLDGTPQEHPWFYRWHQRIDEIMGRFPLDGDAKIEKATPTQVTILYNWHHMDEHGYFEEWETYRVTLRPNFLFGLTVTFSRGRDRDGIKDFFHDSIIDWAESEWIDAAEPEE